MAKQNKPVASFRVGYVKAAVWVNSGENGDFHNVTITRTYKDADGKLQNSDSFGHGDLLAVAKVAERAENFIAQQQAE